MVIGRSLVQYKFSSTRLARNAEILYVGGKYLEIIPSYSSRGKGKISVNLLDYTEGGTLAISRSELDDKQGSSVLTDSALIRNTSGKEHARNSVVTFPTVHNLSLDQKSYLLAWRCTGRCACPRIDFDQFDIGSSFIEVAEMLYRHTHNVF